MLGSEGAIGRVVHRLQTGLPGAMDVLRDRYGVTEQEVPNPRQYLGFEPDQVGVDASPTIYVVEGPTRAREGGRNLARGGVRDAWQFTYTLRVFLIVRGGSYEETHMRSRRLMLGIRETLIGRINFDPTPDEPDIDDDSFLKIAPTTLAEDYTPVGQDRAGRSMRASFIQVEFLSQEWITAYPPPTGTVTAPITMSSGLL